MHLWSPTLLLVQALKLEASMYQLRPLFPLRLQAVKLFKPLALLWAFNHAHWHRIHNYLTIIVDPTEHQVSVRIQTTTDPLMQIPPNEAFSVVEQRIQTLTTILQHMTRRHPPTTSARSLISAFLRHLEVPLLSLPLTFQNNYFRAEYLWPSLWYTFYDLSKQRPCSVFKGLSYPTK